jgi:enamine deaminase RidA (YjgF/YER057c/UK114 family)
MLGATSSATVIWRFRPARRSAMSAGLSLQLTPGPDQVSKVTIFVVKYRHEYLPAIEAGRVALFGDHKPTDTLLGVETLAHPGCLIEIDAVAVLEEP